jgi:hypothetical protein
MKKVVHRSRLKNLLFGSILTFTFFLILEAVLFIFGWDFRKKQATLFNPFDPQRSEINFPDKYSNELPRSVVHNIVSNELTYPDVDLILKVRGNPGTWRVHGYSGVNSMGFRGEEFDFKKSEKRIAVLGNLVLLAGI